MKKLTLLFVAVALLIAFTSVASAQTASGTLTVTATVTGSINLVFDQVGGGVPLGSNGTSNATLAFGTVQAFGGTPNPGVTITPAATSFTISSPFAVNVTKTNSASANYKLTAQLNTVDNTNTWTISGSGNLNTLQTLTTTGTYGTDNGFTLSISIPFTASGAALNINNSIAFIATAN